MKKITQITFLLISLTLNACNPISNSKTETYKVWGNCGMCQKTIEEAAYKKREAKAEWDKDTKIASITFDSTKTNADAILKRIAYSGYDNVKFLAPDDAYAKLAECCQYDRPKRETVTASSQSTNTTTVEEKAIYTCPMHPEVISEKVGKCPKCRMDLVKQEAAEVKPNTEQTTTTTEKTAPAINPLTDVYTAYFSLKDALTKDDGKTATLKAKELLKAIDAVKMQNLKTEEQTVWMKILEDLKSHSAHISESNEEAKQREHFALLSAKMREVIKAIKPDYTVYLDNCPMYNNGKGADWLSKERGIKNPFYGSMMLTCGSVKETIK